VGDRFCLHSSLTAIERCKGLNTYPLHPDSFYTTSGAPGIVFMRIDWLEISVSFTASAQEQHAWNQTLRLLHNYRHGDWTMSPLSAKVGITSPTAAVARSV
jgi:hypothetical protein